MVEPRGTLFAVAGTQKALAFGLPPVMAALLGMLTGIGGGMTRRRDGRRCGYGFTAFEGVRPALRA